jgi:hypothetical protein
MFDWGLFVGDPDIGSAIGAPLCSTTASASFTPPGGTVAAGGWYANPSECGPYASAAPSGSDTISMTANTKSFDPAVSSPTGDLWMLSVNPALVFATFSPLVLTPGQTGTLNVTITPSGAPGTAVIGTLYLDTYDTGTPTAVFGTYGGNEVTAFPYAYTIGN